MSYSKPINDQLLDGFLKYPSLRDVLLKSSVSWLNGRRIDDGYGQMWRVHDRLYDLTDFIGKHPGGKQWIEMTRGMDITESFESSHLNPSVYTLLAKYDRGPVAKPRNSPFTFEQTGFYLTLKRKAWELLKKLSPEEKQRGKKRVFLYQDALLAGWIGLTTAAGLTGSLKYAVLAGLALTLTVNGAHNFFHQRDNWRMYCLDFSFMSSYEWRITHSLSHHNYTNTVWDFEISCFEPFTYYTVRPKTWTQKYRPILSTLVVGASAFFVDGLRRVGNLILRKQKLRPENLLPFTEPLYMWLLGCPLERALLLWAAMQASASWLFIIIGSIPAHHHPELYHAGDGGFKYGNDWGLAQLDAVRERSDIDGHLFAELTMYGNHALHHLFPTIDQGSLELIRPAYIETCREFNVPVEAYEPSGRFSQWEFIVGTFAQAARETPRPIYTNVSSKSSSSDKSFS